MAGKRVLSVGQCQADHGSISRLLQSHFAPEIHRAEDARQALDQMRGESFSLVLVNRVFDANGDSGQDFIRQVKGDPALRDIPIMLISNFPEAQEEASRSGAIPGFGKDALHRPSTVDLLRPYLS